MCKWFTIGSSLLWDSSVSKKSSIRRAIAGYTSRSYRLRSTVPHNRSHTICTTPHSHSAVIRRCCGVSTIAAAITSVLSARRLDDFSAGRPKLTSRGLILDGEDRSLRGLSLDGEDRSLVDSGMLDKPNHPPGLTAAVDCMKLSILEAGAVAH